MPESLREALIRALQAPEVRDGLLNEGAPPASTQRVSWRVD